MNMSTSEQGYQTLIAAIAKNCPESQKPSHQLSWSHDVELLTINEAEDEHP